MAAPWRGHYCGGAAKFITRTLKNMNNLIVRIIKENQVFVV